MILGPLATSRVSLRIYTDQGNLTFHRMRSDAAREVWSFLRLDQLFENGDIFRLRNFNSEALKSCRFGSS